jgi:transposase-like protein
VIKEASADGANFEQIALKYGVTESEVREWVFATASV